MMEQQTTQAHTRTEYEIRGNKQNGEFSLVKLFKKTDLTGGLV